jgi:serine protease
MFEARNATRPASPRNSVAARTMVRALLMAMVVAVLAACDITPPPPIQPPVTAASVIRGHVLVPNSGTSLAGSLGAARHAAVDTDTDTEPGLLSVQFAIAISDPVEAAELLEVDGQRPTIDGFGATEGSFVVHFAGLDVAATRLRAGILSARPAVLYAETVAIAVAHYVPNDPYYGQQWPLHRIDASPAWSLAGAPGSAQAAVIAVLDTGVQPHPDLDVLPGWDFVSGTSGGYDPGGPTRNSSHGTHVAGTAGARTGNGVGIAGAHPNARIVPVRVLGADGSGSGIAIASGIRWAAGESVPGTVPNQYPATVINLSLGGMSTTCPTDIARAVEAAIARGATVVAAAGNEAINAWNVFPANCPGVIAVGATGPDDHRAGYSNFGTRIDIMAPGGTAAAGVLSTDWDYASGSAALRYASGTSMAAPHVSGVMALLRSARPDLTRQQAEQILVTAASPMTSLQCSGMSPENCGAGLLDAAAALASGGDVPNVDTTYVLAYYCIDAACSGYDTSRSWYTTLTPGADEGAYAFTKLNSGTYDVWAFRDLDGNGRWDEGEPWGEHPMLVTVHASVRSDIDIVVSRDGAGTLHAVPSGVSDRHGRRPALDH